MSDLLFFYPDFHILSIFVEYENYRNLPEFYGGQCLECDSSREFHAAKYFYADFKILTFG